jgi:2-methylcitrate dehydratase PrpD
MSESDAAGAVQTAPRLTAELARWVNGLAYGDLPASVVERIKVYTLDCIACGFVGAIQPWSGMVREVVQDSGGFAESSCFATPKRTTMAQAALINGVMIGGFESEHIGHNAHPAGTVFPAAFAIADAGHKSGKEFVLAMAAGYETVCRIGDAQTNLVEIERGFHNPAVNGPFGAAAATAKLLHFNLPTLVNAFGIAGSHAAGIVEYAWHGEMTKRLHLGRAAQWGIESALLASKGFTGPATILEGPYGFFHAFSPAPRPELLLAGIGQRWLLETLTIKAYPCHRTCQAVVAAIQEFKRKQPFAPDEVTGISIRGGHTLLEERFLNRAPDTMMGAQYSIPFTAAMAVYRDLDDPVNYNETALEDRSIRRLAEAVVCQEGPAEQFPDPECELTLAIGGSEHTIQARTFKGATSDPLTLADAEAKFARFTRSLLTPREQADIVDRVRRLERLTKIRPLAKMIRDRWSERLARG